MTQPTRQGPAANDPAADAPTADDPAAGPDYYMEEGRLVFTAAYHLRRGYCCGSGCRHCPYGDLGVRCTRTAQAPARG